MNRIKTNRIIQIVYPYLVYFIVYQLGAALLMDLYAAKIGRLSCLLIAALFCLVPLFIIYKSVPKLIPVPLKDKKELIKNLFWVVAVVALGVIFNIILTHSGIINHSDNFSKASATLTDGNIWIKILPMMNMSTR